MNITDNKFPVDPRLFPDVSESSRLLVGCAAADYSASRIARAVEDCDAHLLNLNVTAMGADSVEAAFPVLFDLRVSHRSTAGVCRSLERYGYTVLDVQEDADGDADTARARVNEFLRYLEI